MTRLWLVGPALTLAVLLVVPLLALVLGVRPSEIGAAMVDSEVLASLGVSLGCAALAVALGLVLGVPAGYLLARGRVPAGRLWQSLLDLPLVIPHPVLGIGLLLVFSRHSLVGAALSEGLGLRVISAAPGIVLAMLLVSAPLIVKAARDGFSAVPSSAERVARSLGASELGAIRTVALPQAAPFIGSGSVLAWARAVSEFGSVVIVAYYPRTAPVLIWDRFSAYGLEAAIAPSVVLLGVCLVIFLLLQSVRRWRPRTGR